MKKGREEEKKRKQTIKVAAAKDILKMSFALFNMGTWNIWEKMWICEAGAYRMPGDR